MGSRGWLLLCACALAQCGGSDAEDLQAKYEEEGEGNPPANGSPFCKGQSVPHALCADFDEGPVEGGWTALDRRGGAVFELGTDPVRSLPNAAVASGKAESGDVAYLVKTLAGPATRAHLAFDMRIEAAGDGNSGATIVKLETSAGYQVTFNVNSAGAVLGCSGVEFIAGGDPTSAMCTRAFTPGTWTHLDVEVTYAEGSGDLLMRIGKKTDALLALPLHASLGTELKISLGVRTYAGTGTWRIAFDNVTID